MLALGRKGMLPADFAVLDEGSGVPKKAVAVMGVLTLVGPFLGNNMLVPLTNVAALGFVFACTMAGFACMKLRKTEPDLPRPYKVNGGMFGIYCAMGAGLLIIGLMVVPFSPAALKPIEWALTLGWLAIGFVILAVFGKQKATA